MSHPFAEATASGVGPRDLRADRCYLAAIFEVTCEQSIAGAGVFREDSRRNLAVHYEHRLRGVQRSWQAQAGFIELGSWWLRF